MTDWLERAAARHPERVALDIDGQALTYTKLLNGARRVPGAVTPDVPAGLDGDDPGMFAISLHACLMRGVAAVPLDPRLTAADRDARLRGCGETDGVATVMFTSGTTSAPKPVGLTVGNWMANALGSAVALGLDREERWLCPMPLAHVGGLSILLRSTIYATTVVLHGRFETEAVLTALMNPDARITLVSLVPTMLARLLDAGLQRPPTLRWALLGGGPIAPALLHRAAAAGVPVAPSYGMTEACSQIATFGWPLTGVDLQIAADGEVLVRGPIVAPGAVADDGWLHTGDLGELDERRRLRVIGRKSDTIVTGGENVAPAEVEAVLLEHPDIADAGVFARADEEWGEAVVAKLVARPGTTPSPEALRAFCTVRLARFKVPKAFEFTAALPRTVSGKLIRRELG